MSDNPIKDRFSISADELNFRMEKQKKLHDEPCQEAVLILEAALDKVLEKLGVNTSQVYPDGSSAVADQMDALGIMMTENTDERTPQINGFFVFVTKDCDIIPYAWVGAARINSNGECFCDIHWFVDNRLDETGGVKLIKG